MYYANFYRSIFSFSGIPIADILLEEIGNRIEKHEMWCKMLLEKGADPSLLISDQNILSNTNFLDAVVYSSTVGSYHFSIDQIH